MTGARTALLHAPKDPNPKTAISDSGKGCVKLCLNMATLFAKADVNGKA